MGKKPKLELIGSTAANPLAPPADLGKAGQAPAVPGLSGFLRL